MVPDSKEFKSLEEFVSEKTLNAIADMGFTTMMEIQHKSIAPLLKGRYGLLFQTVDPSIWENTDRIDREKVQGKNIVLYFFDVLALYVRNQQFLSKRKSP